MTTRPNVALGNLNLKASIFSNSYEYYCGTFNFSDLRGAKIVFKFLNSQIIEAKLKGSDFSFSDFTGSKFSREDLTSAVFSHVNFYRTYLDISNFNKYTINDFYLASFSELSYDISKEIRSINAYHKFIKSSSELEKCFKNRATFLDPSKNKTDMLSENIELDSKFFKEAQKKAIPEAEFKAGLFKTLVELACEEDGAPYVARSLFQNRIEQPDKAKFIAEMRKDSCKGAKKTEEK